MKLATSYDDAIEYFTTTTEEDFVAEKKAREKQIERLEERADKHQKAGALLRRRCEVLHEGLRMILFLETKLNGRAMDWYVGWQAVNRAKEALQEAKIADQRKQTKCVPDEDLEEDS